MFNNKMKTKRIICTKCDVFFETEKALAYLPADDYGNYFLGCHKCCTNAFLKRLKYKKYKEKNRWEDVERKKNKEKLDNTIL